MPTEVIKVVDPDNGSGTDYLSLSAWEAAFGGTTGNLPSDDKIAIAKCRCTGGTADTTACTIAGWTVDATRYIKVWTDPAESYRHNGTYQTGNKYRMETTGANPLVVSQNFVQIYGIQIQATSGAGTYPICINAPAMTNTTAAYCLCVVIVVAAGKKPSGITPGSGSCVVYNNICYAYTTGQGTITDGAGINLASATDKAYNNTVYGYYNNYSAGSYSLLTNNVAQAPVNVCFSGGTLGGGNYNLSSDATAIGANSQKNKTLTFANLGAWDLHLAATDTDAIDKGTNNPANGLYLDDIDGVTRTGTWDIGADEYVGEEPPEFNPVWAVRQGVVHGGGVHVS